MIEFKVPVRHAPRLVACRVAQCLGIGGPLAWEDEEDDGNGLRTPMWKADDTDECGGKFQIDQSNNFWLRKIRTEGDFTIYGLNYRYQHNQELLEHLARWLETPFMLGDH